MKKIRLLLAGILSAVSLTSCVKYGSDRDRSRFSDNIDAAWKRLGVDEYMRKTNTTPEALAAMKEKMSYYCGENYEIKGDYNKALGAKTKYGTYVGLSQGNDVVSWKGIPYAKAPKNELRWKAPQKLKESDKVYEAYHFGHTAVQQESLDEPSGFLTQGEDCLNLNIWVNENNRSTSKAVMVWIHGGGFILGGASEAEYDGTNFVTYNPDIVYVSIDYRVDMLGFINLSEVPGGEEYKDSANLGLLDEVAALTWIQENISAFGGDPSRVTIFGESAGGGSCSALTIIPQAKGLFKRAIIQSGSITNLLRTKEKSVGHTKQILDITGCKSVDDLLELTPEDIRKLARIRQLDGPAEYTLPELDGVTLPKNLKEVFDNGEARDGIEIMSGTTLNEYDYWTKVLTKQVNGPATRRSLEKFEGKLNEEQKAKYEEFRATLPEDSYQRDVDTYSHLVFHTPCRYEAKAHSKKSTNKIYQYVFTESSAPLVDKDGNPVLDPDTGKQVCYGAYHGHELEYLFANYLDDLGAQIFDAFKLSYIMQRMWVNFASTGNPSIAEGEIPTVPAIKWDAYNSTDENVMDINATLCKQVKDPFSQSCNLIGDLFWVNVTQNK